MIPPKQFKGEIIRWLSQERNFHWVIPGKLASSQSPSVDDLEHYASLGINSIINLQEEKTRKGLWSKITDYDMARYTKEDAKNLGLFTLHIPVKDMEPPTKGQFLAFIAYVRDSGRVALAHCYSGIGRTGCMVTAYFARHYDLCGLEAVEKIHEIYPYYIQTNKQMDATIDFIDDVVCRTPKSAY